MVVQSLFKKDKIGYYRINSLIEEYIVDCLVCAQSAKAIHRSDPIKSININGPNIKMGLTSHISMKI